MKIKICKKYTNTKKLKKQLTQAFPNDNIIIRKCLNSCEICQHQPLAKIKGKKLKASRISKLINKIKAKR